MGRTFRLARNSLSVLCIGLALLFAAASAASVLDRAQHTTASPHWHDLHLTASGAADHHDTDQGQDRQHPGHGHHHMDAPTALASPVVGLAEAAPSGDLDLVHADTRSPQGLDPGGFERPPRPIASLA